MALDDLSEDEIGNLPKGRWGVVLAEILDVLTAHFHRRGKSADEAFKESSALTIKLAKHFGGRPIYLPKGKRLEANLKNEEIFRLHNGSNGHELAERFGITLRQVQKIVATQRELNRKKRQGLA